MHSTLVCAVVAMNNFDQVVCAVDKYPVVRLLYTALSLDRHQAIAQVLGLVDFSQSTDVQQLAC